jgi:hypothetical protein
MARVAPLVDGASEVHLITIAESEPARHSGVEGWPVERMPTRPDATRAKFMHLITATP